MKIRLFHLFEGKLVEDSSYDFRHCISTVDTRPSWFDIQDANPEELKDFLQPLELHPLQLSRFLDSVNDPGVITFGNSLLMEYPAAFNQELSDLAYISIFTQKGFLITFRHGPIPALDILIQQLAGDSSQPLLHLTQIVYLMLDEFADINADAQVEIRDQIMRLSLSMSENPGKVSTSILAKLRNQVEILLSLVENQLYCITGLNTSDSDTLQDPHQKAYVQDILSETEITQKGVYRLEARVRDLFNDYQAISNDRVEKRLRLLTLVSAITLPLGLIAGLLGMNVGGVPGTNSSSGFLIVSSLMIVIILIQYWYFRQRGWFD